MPEKSVKPTKGTNHRIGWTAEQEKYLLDNWNYVDFTEMCEHLGRTQAALNAKYKQLTRNEDT
jgi:hypothetical protein